MSDDATEISDAPEVELPGSAGQVAREKPELWRAFQALGAATGKAGPPRNGRDRTATRRSPVR